MIINDSIQINEARSINLGNGKSVYKYQGKYYIKSGKEKKEISAEQYDKLSMKNQTLDKSKKTKEVTSLNLSNGASVYSKNGKYYTKLGDRDPKEISKDDYDRYVDDYKRKSQSKNMVTDRSDLKYGDTFYTVETDGKIRELTYSNNVYDNRRISAGNAFYTDKISKKDYDYIMKQYAKDDEWWNTSNNAGVTVHKPNNPYKKDADSYVKNNLPPVSKEEHSEYRIRGNSIVVAGKTPYEYNSLLTKNGWKKIKSNRGEFTKEDEFTKDGKVIKTSNKNDNTLVRIVK